MKAFLSSLLTLALVFSMAACTSRNKTPPSSSIASSSSSVASSMPSSPSEAPSMPSSNPGLIDDLKSGASDLMSNVESMVMPTMSTDFEKIGALDGNQVLWGPGIQVDEYNRTVGSVTMQEKFGDYGAYFIAPRDCKKLYLTFDEGYENGFTPAILDVLKEKEVSAIFFVTGDFVRTHPELVQRMIDEGHIVGNHTSKHKNPTKVSLEEAYEDMKSLHDYIQEHFGYTMSLYRPPEGAFSEQSLAMVQEMGYTTVLWSFAYADWDPKKQMEPSAALERTEKFIHEGGIYLLHAVSETNTKILGDLIDEIRARGITPAKWDLS